MAEVSVNDHVEVLDPGLAQLREIMRQATGQEPDPNHHGRVEKIEGETVYILFDDTGQTAPYPLDEVRPIP